MVLPISRSTSTVPASTMDTYMMALRGEYCMASFWYGSSIVRRPSSSSLPGGVELPGTGQRSQFSAFHAVGQLSRLAFGWNEVVPAAGYKQGVTQSQDPIGNRIPVMMIVEEPAI